MNKEMYTGFPALLELTRAINTAENERPILKMVITDRLNTRGIIYDRGRLNSLSSSLKEGKVEKVEFGVVFDNEPEEQFEWHPTSTGDELQKGLVTGIDFTWPNGVQPLDKKTFKTFMSSLPKDIEPGEIAAVKSREEELSRKNRSGSQASRRLSFFRGKQQ